MTDADRYWQAGYTMAILLAIWFMAAARGGPAAAPTYYCVKLSERLTVCTTMDQMHDKKQAPPPIVAPEGGVAASGKETE